MTFQMKQMTLFDLKKKGGDKGKNSPGPKKSPSKSTTAKSNQGQRSPVKLPPLAVK